MGPMLVDTIFVGPSLVGLLRLVLVRMLGFGRSPMIVRMRRPAGLSVGGPIGMAVDQDIDFRSGEAAAFGAMRGEFGVQAERRGNACELGQRHSGVHGRAEKHVATDSREAIQVGNPHCTSKVYWPRALAQGIGPNSSIGGAKDWGKP